MLVHLREVLTAAEVARSRALADAAEWSDGRITAGSQSAQVKHNRQLPETAPASVAARAVVLAGLERHAMFSASASWSELMSFFFSRMSAKSPRRLSLAMRDAPCVPPSYRGSSGLCERSP